MERKTVLLVVALSAVAAVMAVGAPGVAAQEDGDLSVSVSQANDSSATVTVTDNGTAVENSSVNVTSETDNVSYAGEGDYETDENGTVGLPAPTENVTINVTASVENETATTTATLNAVEEENESAFGQAVSSFIDSLNINETDGPMGILVSNFVLENNPASEKIPDHAGPPENTTGPPENETGPPEDRGPGGDDSDTDTEDEEEADGSQGPPDHAGPR